MRSDKIVQFVSFETTLDSEKFISKWEQYKRSVNSDLDVILQQTEKNGLFRYIVQHYCDAGELQFVFSNAKRPSRIPEVEIKTKQLGGYSMLQTERTNDARSDESKAFAFLVNPLTDLDIYRQLPVNKKLNIYEAYYENCQYAYVLEFFVKTKLVAELQQQLKQFDGIETAIYKECSLPAFK
jgi:hypothetical protein